MNVNPIGPLFLWEKLVLGQAGVSPRDEMGVLQSLGAGSFWVLPLPDMG